MLKTLTIQNLAIVKQLEIVFEDGFTVLTGETGAGKSILIDALGLALGERADSSMIRSGSDAASVTAVFDVAGNALVKQVFSENDLIFDDECLLRRVVNADGRSRAYCNATPIPIQLLRSIGETLVDIHAQHAHQSLLRRSSQRDLLDEYGGLSSQLEAVQVAAKSWRELVDEQRGLLGGVENVSTRIDLLQYQLDELSQHDIERDSIRQLEIDHKRSANAA